MSDGDMALSAAIIKTPGYPKNFGSYILLEPLDKGAMAKVALAYNPKTKNIVILKRPLLEEAPTERRARFLDEAKISFQLNHPNLIKALEQGEVEGEPFLTIERLHGQDLESILSRSLELGELRPLPIVAAIIEDILDGLAFAHEKVGFVHRDISLGNVLVGYDGRARLIDYGFALFDLKETKTRPGIVPGTIDFVAPECFVGGKAGPWSDLYALGQITVTLLALHPIRVEGEFTKDKFLQKLPEWLVLPAGFVDFLVKSLEPLPVKRFQTAAEMKAALKQALNEPIASRQDVGVYVSDLFPVEKKYEAEKETIWQNKIDAGNLNLADVAAAPGLALQPRRDEQTRKPQRGRSFWVFLAIAMVTSILVLLNFSLLQEALTAQKNIAISKAPTPPSKTVLPEIKTPAPEPGLKPVIPNNPHVEVLPEPAKGELQAQLNNQLKHAVEAGRNHRIDEARHALQELQKHSSMKPKAKFALAELEYREGHFAQTVSLTTEAIALGLKEKSYVLRAHAELKLNRVKDAERDFKEALELNPKSQDAQAGLSLLLELPAKKDKE